MLYYEWQYIILIIILIIVSIIIILTPWAQDVNWTYVRLSEDVLDIFWTSYIHSIYVLCPGGMIVIIILYQPESFVIHSDHTFRFIDDLITIRKISGIFISWVGTPTPRENQLNKSAKILGLNIKIQNSHPRWDPPSCGDGSYLMKRFYLVR